MKKQILVLVLLVMAIFSITTAFGQATHFSGPKASVGCTNDALHPIAGKPYNYVVSSDATAATYTWWATINPAFVTAGVLQSTIAANVLDNTAVVPTTASQYNSSVNNSGTIQLTWGTDVLANAMKTDTVPAFVAVYSKGSSCSDNLKVFRVKPVNAFMVDIKNIDNAKVVAGALLPADTLAYGVAESQCYDKVQGATYASNKMTYDYGTNILYYEVIASNFSKEWTPTFTLTGLVTAAQTAAIQWAYTPAFSSPVTVVSGTPTSVVGTDATNTSKGVSIFVKVTITNSTYEGITAGGDPITLAVTGTNTSNQRDVKSTDCTLADDTNIATQNLDPRPIITETTNVGTFQRP